jgi:hypothetical protein
MRPTSELALALLTTKETKQKVYPPCKKELKNSYAKEADRFPEACQSLKEKTDDEL